MLERDCENVFDAGCLAFVRKVLADNFPRECLFLAKADRTGRVIEVTLVEVGNENSVPVACSWSEIRRHDLMIHSHPHHNIQPSQEDADYCNRLIAAGIGDMIVDCWGRRAHIVARWNSRKRLEYEESLRRHERIKTLISSWN